MALTLDAEKKKQLRLAGILFLINLAIIIASYSIYVFNFHYGPDTFSTTEVEEDIASINLRNSRIVHFALYSVLGMLGFDVDTSMLMFFQILLSIVIAIITTGITLIFNKLFSSQNILRTCIVDCLALMLFINPCFLAGWYYFPETLFGDSFSTFITFCAIWAWCSTKRSLLKRAIISFILLLISLEMYQIYIEPYVIICLAFTMMSHKFKFDKKCVIEIAVLLVLTFIAGLIVMFISKTLLAAGLATRSFADSPGSIIDSVINALGSQKLVWGTMVGTMPKFVLIAFILVMAVIFAVGQIRKKRTAKELARDIVCTILCFAIIWFVIFFPDIITWNAFMARTVIGAFALVFALGMFALFSFEGNRAITIAIGAISLAMLALLFVNNLQIQIGTLQENEKEISEMTAVLDAISEYEDQTGNEVTEIRYGYDAYPLGEYKDVVRSTPDINLRCLAKSWFVEYALNYYAPGGGYDISQMTSEEKAKYIGGSNWDSFNPDDQVFFDRDACYYIVY